MSQPCRLPFRLLGLVGALLLGSGCQILPEAQPDPTRYFVLSAPMPAAAKGAPGEGRTLGLRPIELPGYLRNTRSLVVAHGPHELSFREEERWAEPLDIGLARVFRETWENLEGVDAVTLFPFSGQQDRDLDVTLRILHCEGVDRGGARAIRFVASYEIARAGAAGEVVKRGVFAAPEAPWDGEPAALAARLGEAAAAAAAAIGAELP